MSMDLVLKNDERAIFALRALYERYGYSQYKMSKFEEYDLYVKNKDFLVSENIITFTDTDGKLMALKPDVTLSIIKNSKDTPNGVYKLFYDENVYRVSKGTKTFKEIVQAGLECLGDVDDYVITEVLSLAVKSLESISESYVLDVSSLDVIESIMEEMELDASQKKQIISFLAQKNSKGIENALSGVQKNRELTELIVRLANTFGNATKIKQIFDQYKIGEKTKKALDRLINIAREVSNGKADKVRIDFSVVNNLSYYNGIVFKGFVSGIPTGILSGGQYDNLMLKMGKRSKGIGFAVYLDELNKLNQNDAKYDVDVVVVYKGADLKEITGKVNEITKSGKRVLAVKNLPEKLKYKTVVTLGQKE